MQSLICIGQGPLVRTLRARAIAGAPKCAVRSAVHRPLSAASSNAELASSTRPTARTCFQSIDLQEPPSPLALEALPPSAQSYSTAGPRKAAPEIPVVARPLRRGVIPPFRTRPSIARTLTTRSMTSSEIQTEPHQAAGKLRAKWPGRTSERLMDITRPPVHVLRYNPSAVQKSDL